ncbi:MAG: LysM peptidoglycan-binding domain-containing protein [Elusimicrobiota bacterium]
MVLEKIFLAALALFQLSGVSFTSPGEYVITSGDTLWDLAQKYYNDPWKWTEIYEANKNVINDPHWIYPGHQIEIPDITVASAKKAADVESTKPVIEPPKDVSAEQTPEKVIEVVEPSTPPEQAKVDTKAAAKPKGEILSPDEKYMGDTFIVEGTFKYDGRIVGIKERKTLIAQGDIIYIDIGTAKGLSKGSMCYVFRKKGRVRTPGSMHTVGTQVIRVGVIELTGEVNKNSATAIVRKSFEPIVIGDYIKIIR